ncbi:hypothetical protein IB239_01875 [Pseudomonas sp. PDM12]|uniref:hypothetical protein n=1 Tax=Pseudomonas sp. PDM12 TaxID=2769260 RepID=UPI00177CF8E8|nr:hypothetical protein [Pseudomonas sp. PDM12]MBD9653559.1 hypothetical protein [Pseudomonas sp. PDM12]
MRAQLIIGAALGVVGTIFLALMVLAFVVPDYSYAPSTIYNFLKDIVGPVAAGFGGALAGAYASYSFQERTLASAENKVSLKVYNKAIMVLVNKYAELLTFKMQVIAPHENVDLRFVTIPELIGFEATQEKVAYSICELLLSVGEGDLFKDLVKAESGYSSAMAAIKERSLIYGEHRARSDQVSIIASGSHDLNFKALVSVHGIPALVRLYQETEGMISTVDTVVEILFNALKRLDQECGPKIKDYLGGKVIVSEINYALSFKRSAKPFYENSGQLISALESGVHKNY